MGGEDEATLLKLLILTNIFPAASQIVSPTHSASDNNKIITLKRLQKLIVNIVKITFLYAKMLSLSVDFVEDMLLKLSYLRPCYSFL